MSGRRSYRLLRAIGVCLIGLVAAPAWAQTEIHIEAPVASTSVTQPLALGGWAVDQSAPTGTGVDQVYVYYCPSPCTGTNLVFLAPAHYGEPRPDVGAALGTRFTNSQFWLIVTGLAPGVYDFVLYAHSTGTEAWSAQGVSGVTLVPSPVLSIEGPAPQQSITTPYTLSGWAADFAAPTGTGIDQVVAVAFPNPGSGVAPLGMPAASVGNARTDVEAAVFNAQFRPTGWTLALPSGALPANAYLFAVYAHDTVTNGWVIGTQFAFIDAPQVPLTVDRAGGGTGGVSSSPAGLACPGGFGTQALPCETTYLQSSAAPVILTATADVGSTFAGWSGACTGTGICEVTMNQGRYVTATFAGIAAASFQTTYYHADAVGSVRAITDAAGQPVTQRSYAPFGEDPGALTGDPVRFTGQELDAETSLQYFGARYYRNTIGRFTTTDPGQVGAHVPSPQTWNAYAYAGNNPLRWVDRFGLDYEVCVEGSCAVFVGDWDDFVAVLGEGGVSAGNGGLYHSSRAGSFGWYNEIGRSSELERDPSVLRAIFEALGEGGGGGGDSYEPPYQGKGGGPGSNDGTANNPFVPQDPHQPVPQEEPRRRALGPCVSAAFAPSPADLSYLTALPLSKSIFGRGKLMGSSSFTNLGSFVAEIFSTSSRLPVPILKTTNPLRAMARSNRFLAAFLVGWDAGDVLSCMRGGN